MKMKKKSHYITLATIAFWAVVLIGWHLYDPSSRFVKFEPGADKRPEGSARKADDVVIGEFFMKYNATFTEGMKDQWSGFRGKDRTNIVNNAVSIKLAKEILRSYGLLRQVRGMLLLLYGKDASICLTIMSSFPAMPSDAST